MFPITVLYLHRYFRNRRIRGQEKELHFNFLCTISLKSFCSMLVLMMHGFSSLNVLQLYRPRRIKIKVCEIIFYFTANFKYRMLFNYSYVVIPTFYSRHHYHSKAKLPLLCFTNKIYNDI